MFPKASEEDVYPAPNTLEFAEYCEAAGWKFVDAKRKFCIFKKIEQDAMDLFTPDERVENIFNRGIFIDAVILLILYGLNAVIGWFNLCSMFEDEIFSSSSLGSVSVWTVMFLCQLGKLLLEYRQYRKLKKKLNAGDNIYIGNRQNRNFYFNASDVYKIILLLLLFGFCLFEKWLVLILSVGFILVICLVSMITDKLKLDKETNVAFFAVLAIVFVSLIMAFWAKGSGDESSKEVVTPLVSKDYRDDEDVVKEISYDGERNVLGSVDRYMIFEEEEYIHYDIYKSKHAWILDRIWDELNEGSFDEETIDCTADWGAKEALTHNNRIYYVRYEQAILVFGDSEESHLSEAQIDTILKKLELR